MTFKLKRPDLILLIIRRIFNLPYHKLIRIIIANLHLHSLSCFMPEDCLSDWRFGTDIIMN